MQNNAIVKILQDLSLTEYEAKALVSLFKYDESDAPTLSRNSEIPKTRIYDVLEKLKKRGLVLEVYGRPKKFKAIEPNEIFKNLVSEKSKEVEALGRRVDDILAKENWKLHMSNTKERILQVKDIKDYNKLLAQELDTAKREIYGFTHLDERHPAFKNIMARKDLSVKIISRPLTKNLDFPKHISVQEADNTLDAFVLDSKKVILALNDLSIKNKAYNLTIQENNPSLAKALLNHFNSFWKK